MKNNIKRIVLFSLCSLTSYAQSKRPFYCTEFISGNIAYLTYKVDAQEEVNPSNKWTTRELKLGVCLIKPIGEHFELRSRIGYGIKFGRLRENVSLMPFNSKGAWIERMIYTSLNEDLTKDVDFIDIPLILYYKVARTNLGIEAGFNYRSYKWFYRKVPIVRDYGPLCNLTYSFKNFSVFLGYTMGLRDMFSESAVEYFENRIISEYGWSAKSNAVQFGLEYNLFQKLKEK